MHQLVCNWSLPSATHLVLTSTIGQKIYNITQLLSAKSCTGDANLLRALGHGSDAICPSLLLPRSNPADRDHIMEESKTGKNIGKRANSAAEHPTPAAQALIKLVNDNMHALPQVFMRTDVLTDDDVQGI